MKLRRRTMLVAICAAAAAVSVTQLSGPVRRNLHHRRIAEAFDVVFGQDVSQTEAGAAFLDDWMRSKRVLSQGMIDEMAQAFLKHSNFMRYHELGEALSYDGIASPYDAPCQNYLSAAWSPDA